MLHKEVSVGYRVYNPGDLTICTVEKIFETIKKSPDISEIQNKLHLIDNEKEQKRFKKNNLPYFNLGTFKENYRKNTNIISTSFLLYDYDDINESLTEVINKLKTDKNVYAFFVSPRGNGVKVIYLIDKEITDHKYFSAIYKYYAEQFSIDLGEDPDTTSDVSRPCFFSYDPNIYINTNAEPLSTDVNVKLQPVINFKEVADEETQFVMSAVEYLSKEKISYNEWIRCGLALASLGEEGRKYFHTMSLNPNFNDTLEEINQQYNELLENGTGEVKLATLFQIALDYGYEYPELKKAEIGIPIPFDKELEEQFALDDMRDPNKLLGLPLTKFKELAKNIDGLQVGFYLLGAESNVGKTALLTNLCMDILDTNPDSTVVYFSLDDSRKYTTYRFLSIKTQLHINETRKQLHDPIKKQSLDNARNEFLNYIRTGRLIVKDIGTANHIDHLEAEIKKVKDKSKLVVFVDGLYNMEVGDRFKSIREENIERARQVKALVDTYRIPILTTGELRKKDQTASKDKTPTMNDLMETGKFAYNANVVWLLYGKAEELVKAEPFLTLEFVKNKLSDYKGIQDIQFKRATGTMIELPMIGFAPAASPFLSGDELE
jgi:replicative DNA helicase